MRINESQLRRMIRAQVRLVLEAGETPDVGKDIKGSAASEKAAELLDKVPGLSKAIDNITTADGLADFLQAVLAAATKKGIDRNEVVTALKKVGSAVMKGDKT